jgi:galactokinase
MDPVSMRRAEHFFSECKRVKKGLSALADADLEGFGGLMSASGESLTSFFDCGTPETRDLLEILRGERGVLGASYAGGGFGGMLQAIARPGVGAHLESGVRAAYRERHPACAERLKVTVVGSGPGAGLL